MSNTLLYFVKCLSASIKFDDETNVANIAINIPVSACVSSSFLFADLRIGIKSEIDFSIIKSF